MNIYTKKDETSKDRVFDSGNKGSQASPAARKGASSRREFREETDSSISARFGVIVRPRESSWLFVRHFMDRLGALRERNTGSHYAKRVPWRELRETGRKRDRGGEKRKNKERRGGEGEPRERLEKERGRRQKRGRERTKYPRETERTEIRGTGIFAKH